MIGNSKYAGETELPNASKDAADIAKALEGIGFEVTLVANADWKTMRRALLEFGDQAANARIAVAYFAGHGIEVGGKNWLIPVDAQLKIDKLIADEAHELDFVRRMAEGAGKLGLVIVDACRDNPFRSKMKHTIKAGSSPKSVDRGFAPINDPNSNVLISFSAAAGKVAKDGPRGKNSPYAAALLKHLSTPGLEVRFLAGHVRDAVMVSTNNFQQPHTYGSLGGEKLYLVPPVPLKATTNTAEEQALTALASQTRAGYEAFLKAHPNSKWATVIRAHYQRLTGDGDSDVAPDSDAGTDTGTSSSDSTDLVVSETGEQALAVLTKPSISRHEAFLEAHPNSQWSDVVRNEYEKLSERRDWKRAEASNSVTGYAEYVARHPTGANSIDAKKFIAEKAFKRGTQFLWMKAFDMYGNDFVPGKGKKAKKRNYLRVSKNKCWKTCHANPSCRAFTYNTSNRNCFLKDAIFYASPDKRAETFVRLADIDSIEFTRMKISHNSESVGRRYREFKGISLQACLKNCERDGLCNRFNYQRSLKRCELIDKPGGYRRNKQMVAGSK